MVQIFRCLLFIFSMAQLIEDSWTGGGTLRLKKIGYTHDGAKKYLVIKGPRKEPGGGGGNGFGNKFNGGYGSGPGGFISGGDSVVKYGTVGPGFGHGGGGLKYGSSIPVIGSGVGYTSGAIRTGVNGFGVGHGGTRYVPGTDTNGDIGYGFVPGRLAGYGILNGGGLIRNGGIGYNTESSGFYYPAISNSKDFGARLGYGGINGNNFGSGLGYGGIYGNNYGSYGGGSFGGSGYGVRNGGGITHGIGIETGGGIYYNAPASNSVHESLEPGGY